MSRYFQQFYVFRSAAFLGVVLLLAGFAAYGVLWVAMSGEPEGEKTLLERVGLMVWFAVALYGIVAAFLILLLGLFATHKVAGPLYRLEKVTTEAMGGKIPGEIHFREGDQMQPLARAQSLMFSYLGDREREFAEAGSRIEKRCCALAEAAVTAAPDEWSRLVQELRADITGVSAAVRSPGGRA